MTGVQTCALPISAAGRRPHGHIRLADARANYARVFSNPKALFCFGTVMLEAVSFYGVTPYVGELIEREKLGTPMEAGLVIGAFGVGGIFYSLILPLILRNFRRRTMMACGGLLGTAGVWGMMLALPWQAQALLMGVSGFGFFLLHNCVQAEVAGLNEESRSLAFAMHSCSFFTGAAVGPVGSTAGVPVRSWGGTQSASAQSSGASMMCRYCTPGWKLTSPPSSASRALITAAADSESGWPPAKSTIVPSGPTLTRLQR